MNLVIAEKPSVARSIATVIGADEKQNGYWQGGGYLVSWCIGHLVSFAEAGQYDEKYCKWKYEDLPILPQPWQFIVPDEKKQQFEIVRSLLNRPDVDSVTAATDAGREGELIFRFVYQMAGCTKPVKRLWISSMEDAAIREGFANLRPDSDYDALYLPLQKQYRHNRMVQIIWELAQCSLLELKPTLILYQWKNYRKSAQPFLCR